MAQPNGDVKADAKAVGPWEKWIVKPKQTWIGNEKFTIMSKQFKKYLVAEPSGKVKADRTRPLQWEHFKMSIFGSHTVG